MEGQFNRSSKTPFHPAYEYGQGRTQYDAFQNPPQPRIMPLSGTIYEQRRYRLDHPENPYPNKEPNI